MADFAERYGRVPGGALAVLAMGKLGSREMLPGSDLDLVLLYDHDPEATGSEGGRRSLAPSEYFIRLAPQVVSAITAPGAEGRLWEVDMRLRPSGNKGPVAVRLSHLRALPHDRGLDLGAHGADPGAADRRSAGDAAADRRAAARRHHPARRGAIRRWPMRWRCGSGCCATCRRRGPGT